MSASMIDQVREVYAIGLCKQPGAGNKVIGLSQPHPESRDSLVPPAAIGSVMPQEAVKSAFATFVCEQYEIASYLSLMALIEQAEHDADRVMFWDFLQQKEVLAV